MILCCSNPDNVVACLAYHSVRHKGESVMKEGQVLVKGGCLCGELRYEATAAPFDGTFCHCSMCRKSTGGLFSIGVFFNWSDFRMVQGEPKYYQTELGRYAFCENCGSTIYGAYDGASSLYVYLGGLDSPDDWPANTKGWSGHVFVDDKVSWHEINDGLPQHAASVGYFDDSKAQHEEKDSK